MAHCGQRVRFAATWREEFFEVPLNDSEHWHARAEEARLLANEMKDSEAKDALVRIADSHEHLVQWVENWALRRLPKN